MQERKETNFTVESSAVSLESTEAADKTVIGERLKDWLTAAATDNSN